MFGLFSARGGGGLPNSKLFEDLPDSKDDEELFLALAWTFSKDK